MTIRTETATGKFDSVVGPASSAPAHRPRKSREKDTSQLSLPMEPPPGP
jgi:hypothetical protein